MSVRLPSWFWFLVCVSSFGSSVLAWSLERPGKARQVRHPATEVATSIEPDATTVIAPSPRGAQPAPAEVAPPTPVQATFVVALPGDTDRGTKVLRCVVRGRVTYVDVTTACADGSQGKVTVLPR